ncbi:hypothetical protein V8F33_004491 [Rhypophila sp. PSN 637]
MGSTQGLGSGDGRDGGGGPEEGGGDPSERARSRSDNQKKKGNIGRPRNKPPPPPREVPIEIIPRPQENGQHGKRRRSSTPTAGASAQIARLRTPGYQAPPSADTSRDHGPKRLRQPRPPRKLTDNLKEGEFLIDVTLLAPNGSWVKVINCLLTPHWKHSFILPETVEAFSYEPTILKDADSRTSVTPRGENRDNRLVGFYMELNEMNIPEHMIVLPIFNKMGLGVSLILGKPFIEAFYGPGNWPPSADTRYVSLDRVADSMPIYDMNQAAWHHGLYNDDDGGGIQASMDPNVYLSGVEINAINHDLTAVGAGIPADYSEFTPDWDGYLQEN